MSKANAIGYTIGELTTSQEGCGNFFISCAALYVSDRMRSFWSTCYKKA